MKQTLSVEQSAELIKRGVTLNENDSEVFDIVELLSLMPKEIDKIYSLEILADNSGWDMVYDTFHEGYEPRHIACNKELVNALYEALLWAIDNNHVKLD